MSFDQFLKQLGAKVAAARKSLSLRQRDAAEKAGISYRYYQSIETGRANVTIATICRLAGTYGVHPCDLLPSRTEL